MNTVAKTTKKRRAKKAPVKSKSVSVAVATTPQAQPTMTDQLLTLAVDKDLDMDKLERLIAMKDREEEKTARSLFNVAMARVQSNIQPIIADGENLQTDSKYAKLAAIVTTLAPVYTAEGFSVTFGTAECKTQRLIDAGWTCTTAELAHAGGYSKEFYIELPADTVGIKGSVNKTVIHGTKSAITYARVILFGLMFNFTTSQDSDTDGNMPGDTITEEQVAVLRDHLSVFDDAEVCESDLCNFLKVESLDDLPVRLLSKAQKAIAEQKKAEGLK